MNILRHSTEASCRSSAQIHPDYEQEIHEKIRVRIGNYTVQKGLREINADLINKLVSVSGMVVRSSEVKPLAKKVAYKCTNCNTVTEAQLKGLVMKKPLKCHACSEKELEMDPETAYLSTSRWYGYRNCRNLPAGQCPTLHRSYCHE